MGVSVPGLSQLDPHTTVVARRSIAADRTLINNSTTAPGENHGDTFDHRPVVEWGYRSAVVHTRERSEVAHTLGAVGAR